MDGIIAGVSQMVFAGLSRALLIGSAIRADEAYSGCQAARVVTLSFL